jgi:hypothetical protein
MLILDYTGQNPEHRTLVLGPDTLISYKYSLFLWSLILFSALNTFRSLEIFLHGRLFDILGATSIVFNYPIQAGVHLVAIFISTSVSQVGCVYPFDYLKTKPQFCPLLWTIVKLRLRQLYDSSTEENMFFTNGKYVRCF